MNTAAQQSAGGSTAGAVGQGGLYAARTRNAGGAQNAIGNATRGAGANLSKVAVGTELASNEQAQQNQQRGISGLQGLYGTEIGQGENALGLSNEALGVAAKAKPSFWQSLATDAIDPIAAGFGGAVSGRLFGGSG